MKRRAEERGQQIGTLFRVGLRRELESEVGEGSYPRGAFGAIEEHQDMAVVGWKALA